MSSPPSAAQTLAYSACRVIWQPKSKLASAGWTAGGTKGQSIMIPPTGQTMSSVQGDMNEARAKRCRTDYVWKGIVQWTWRNISSEEGGRKRGSWVERERNALNG